MMSFPRKLRSSRKQHLIYGNEEDEKFEEKTYKAKRMKDENQKETYSKLKIDKLTTSLNNNQSTLNNEEEMNCCNFKQMTGDDLSAPRLMENSELNELNSNSNDKFFVAKTNDSSANSSFLITIKRLLTNKILLCRIASTVFHILPVSGLYTFLPKYLEYQFRITASDASFLSGIAGILVMGLGIFSSGLYMRKFNPNPKCISRWISIATLLYVCGMIALMFLGCPLPKISNLNTGDNSLAISSCPNCNCESNQFMPICASNAITYLSPCLAGCTRFNRTNNEFNYLDCKCLPDKIKIIKSGLCDVQCNNLSLYIALFSLIALLHSTTEVGAMLLTLRSVDSKDKTVALGLVAFVTSLFGSLPCPTLYGWFIDWACIFWQKNCDTNGACRLYDSDKFRIYFHGLTAFFMFLAFLFDVSVWLMSSQIDFLDGNEKNEANNLQATDCNNQAKDKLNNDTNNNSNNQEKLNEEIKNSSNLRLLAISSNDGNNNNNLLIEECKILNNRTGESLVSS